MPISAPLRAFLEGSDRAQPLIDHWPQIHKGLTRAARRAQIVGEHERLSPNDLRRTFASWLKQAGVDSLTAAHLMGHSSTAMIEKVYGQLDEATYQGAVARLPGVVPSEHPLSTEDGAPDESTHKSRTDRGSGAES